MIEQYVPSLGWEDPLEKAKATHSSILACRIPWRSHKDLDTTEWLSLSEQYVDIFSIKLKIGDSNRYLYTDVHSRIIHNSPKVKATKIFTDRHKMQNLLVMHYCSVLKMKENLTHDTMWMNLEDIMLSEISQSQKVKYCMIPFRRGP